MILLSSLFIPVITWLLILEYFIDNKSSLAITFLKISLAIGLGFGCSSIIYFLWLFEVGSSIVGFIVIEISLLLALMAYKFIKNWSEPPIFQFPTFRTIHSESIIAKIILVSFMVAMLFDIIGFIYWSLNHPHGFWDAYGIWNARARYLFRGGKYVANAFSPEIWHADYPPLISSFIARCWSYTATDSVVAPILVAMIFTFGTIGLVTSSVSLLRSRSQGLLAGLVLLGTTPFIVFGSAQCADVPLGFFFLATIIFLRLHEGQISRSYSLLSLAGMAAGLAAWTKNEGLLFLLVIVITRLIILLRIRGWQSYLKELCFFSLGLIPILLVIYYFKSSLAPQNDIIIGQGYYGPFERLFMLPRYYYVAKSFIINFIILDARGYLRHDLPITLVLAVYPLFLGINIEKKDRLIIFTSILVIFLMMIGYFFAYIITPHDLFWHVTTSLKRLLIQLWPIIIFTYFLIIRTPEQALYRK